MPKLSTLQQTLCVKKLKAMQGVFAEELRRLLAMQESECDDNTTLRINSVRKKIISFNETIARVIQTGEYGTCQHCGEEISRKRLLEEPCAIDCTECGEKMEEKQKKNKQILAVINRWQSAQM